MSFLDVQIIREDKTFITYVYRKSSFGGVCNILTAFYHISVNLVLLAHSVIDASEHVQVGINYILN